MNVLNEVDRGRLFKAMTASYEKLAPFRRLNAGLIEEYAGSGYGQRVQQETLMNLMEQAVSAYVMKLVANRPRVMISTHREELRFFARHFTVAINNMLQQITLEDTLQRWVTDAFFCLGVVKTHWDDAGEVQMWDGESIDPGTPRATNIGLDDWVHDMSAKRWDQVQFAGDCYRLPLEDLKDARFDQAVVKELVASNRASYNDASDRVEMLSQGYQTDQDDVEPMVDVMDVWVPREKQVCTFAMESGARFTGKGKPLAVDDWDGPELGMYFPLGFGDVPQNIMPASPASHLASLSRLANNLMRKQSRQARRQKDVGTYTPAGAESAKKIQRADDGGFVEVMDGSELGMMKFGGVDAGNQAFLMHVIETFDRMAGNLATMAGLGQQGDTLGQEQLLTGAASQRVGQMRIKCLNETRKLVRALAHMLWQDQAKVIDGQMEVPGVEGATIAATWHPDFRMGQFYDYDLDIDIYSLPYQPQEVKLQTINSLLTQVYIPLGPMLQQQGGQIDMQALTDIYAELTHTPRLKEIIRFSAMPTAEMAPANEPASPATTTRQYVRRNVPSGQDSASQDQIQSLLESSAQGQQSSFN